MYLRVPLAQQQSIPAAGATLNYNFKAVTPRIGLSHLHVAGIELDAVLDITAGVASSAVGIFDFPAWFNSIVLQRTPMRPILTSIHGPVVNNINAMGAQGIPRGIFPASIASNAGAVVRKIRFCIMFDRPFAGVRRYDRCWPLGAFVREGLLQVAVTPNPTNSAVMSFTDGNGTLDANLLCVPMDEPQIPPDIRYEMVDTTTTGSLLGQLFSAGVYSSLIYCPWKFANGGGDSLTNVTIDGTPYQQGNILRKLLASRYAEQWLDFNVLDMKDSNSINLVVQCSTPTGGGGTNSGISPLWEGGLDADVTKSVFIAPTDFRMDASLSSGSLAVGHRWFIGRVWPRSQAEVAQIAAVHGIDITKVLQEDITLGDPAMAARKSLLPMRLTRADSKKGRSDFTRMAA